MLKRFSKKPITSFQRKVYEVVKKIPKGEVLSYQQVARLTGYPKACRAVGNALNKNPDPKTIPCHRVIRANGKIGGFKGGQKKKIRLLRKEGVIIKNRSCLTKK
ncbi:MGMT family protein [Candidatus Microgenomates bacterium]|nr:MGMT family protein [Candidatus Microgenomates bacterium]